MWCDNPGIKLFNEIVRTLYKNNSIVENNGIWSDGEKILCESETTANAIADLIDMLCGSSVSVTGYYDPDEDRRTGNTDMYTGYHYVDIG